MLITEEKMTDALRDLHFDFIPATSQSNNNLKTTKSDECDHGTLTRPDLELAEFDDDEDDNDEIDVENPGLRLSDELKSTLKEYNRRHAADYFLNSYSKSNVRRFVYFNFEKTKIMLSFIIISNEFQN